jgi:hypothetical protein
LFQRSHYPSRFTFNDLRDEISEKITNLDNIITSISYILTGLENTHIKESIRDLGFQINDLRNEIKKEK